LGNIINICGRKACCPQILEENGQYQIFDEAENWKTNFMTKEKIKQIGKTINKL
jgi:hypothetical protein